jgi:hypothetical protein
MATTLSAERSIACAEFSPPIPNHGAAGHLLDGRAERNAVAQSDEEDASPVLKHSILGRDERCDRYAAISRLSECTENKRSIAAVFAEKTARSWSTL